MGVVLGDRRKILRAISLIGSEAPAVPQGHALDLARLWRDQCKRTEAHDLLAPVPRSL